MDKRAHWIHIILLCFTIGVMFVGCGKRPSKVALLREQKFVQDSLALLAQQQSLAYYQTTLDSLLPLAQALLNRNFRYEKNEAYEDHGHYVHQLLRTTANSDRNYVQTYVSDDYRISVKVYTLGSRPLYPSEVAFSVGEQYNIFTGSSHSFEQEQWHDILTLTDTNAISALHFIDLYRSEPITIRLQGKKSKRSFRLSERDKQALLDTYQLGCLMQDIHNLEKYIQRTNKEIEKYEYRIHNRA